MPNFKFQGFSTGSEVAIAVTQGGNSDSAAVPSWKQASSMTLALSATRITGVAPMGALFSADAASDHARVVSPFHDIEGVWDYDDPGNFANLGNSPLWGTDSNIGYGPRGTHVFSGPGNYEVAHTAFDGAGSLTETISVAVEDPDAIFAGADTAVVSLAGNFANAPSGASQFTSISAALTHLAGRQRQRLLLRHDETYTSIIAFEETTGSGRRAFVGRFGGTSARPLIDKSSVSGPGISFRGAGYSEIVIADLRIRGNVDVTATVQTTVPNGGGISFSFGDDSPLDAHKTIWNCEITDVGMGINCDGASDSEPNRRLYVGDTRITGWQNYGLLSGDGGEFGFSGCSFKQPTGTQNGQAKGGPDYWPDHGPFRLSRPNGMCVFSNCDFTSFNDWSASSSSQTFQNPIRWNSGGSSDGNRITSDEELVIDRFRTESGAFEIFNATGGGNGVTDNFVVVDRLHIVHADLSKNTFVSPMGGVTIRNAIGVVPNVPPGASTGIQQMFNDSVGSPKTAGSQTRRSEFYSNALIDLRSDANAKNRSGPADSKIYKSGGFSDLTNSYWGNNITHAPNMVTGGETGQAPLDATPQWSVWYDGERWEGGAVDTARAYGDEPTASFRPMAGSAAIGGATGKVSLLDFDGNLRTDILAALARVIPSEGPYEPALES